MYSLHISLLESIYIYTQGVRAISSQKKALVDYLESFSKRYNKGFFHRVLFEL